MDVLKFRTVIEETVSFDPSKDGSYWISSSKRPGIKFIVIVLNTNDKTLDILKGGKKATLCAWMTLQSIPQETIITPNILEFLEQVSERKNFLWLCLILNIDYRLLNRSLPLEFARRLEKSVKTKAIYTRIRGKKN